MGMDHAEAHEQIADLALDRAALARLAAGGPDDRPLLEHVRGCEACRTDLAAVQALDRTLRDALGEVSDTSAIQPIAPPDSLRAAVLGVARAEPRLAPTPRIPRATDTRRGGPWRLELPRLSRPQWAVGLAAVLVVAILGGFAGRALAPAASGPEASLVAAVATLDRVLAAPDHRIVALKQPTGEASGSVAWSAQDFVVLTSSLSAPGPGQVYRCWLQWAGRWEAVGTMEFTGTTAYWSGAAGDWTQLLADPGVRFVVTAEAAGPAADVPSGAVLLQAGLASS